jgi:hypothetical protein
MPPPLQVTNGAQLRLIFIINAEVAINVLGARVTGTTPINQALADTLGSAIKSAWTTNMAPLCTVGTTLQRVGIKDVRAPNLSEFLDTGAVVSGIGVGDALPAGVAQVVTLRTGSSGKSFRGRVYVGGFDEAQNDANGNTIGAANTAAVNFITAIRTTLTTNGLTLAVMSRPAERVQIVTTTFHADGTTSVKTVNHAARAGGVTDVTALEVRNARWKTQRRRMNGRAGTAASFLGSVVKVTF